MLVCDHRWWRMGRAVVLRRGNEKDKPLSSATAIQDAIFTDQSAPAVYEGRSPDGSPKKPKGKYEEETASRQFSKKASENKLGHLSTYYSDAVVCERCYMVYRELDNAREKKARSRRDDCRLQKEAEMLDKKGFSSMDEYSRAIEHRIFKQRKFVSRLAKIKQPKIKDEDLRASVGQGLAGDSFFDELGGGLPTNSMSHISSIQAEGSFFPYQNSYFDSDGVAAPGGMGLKKKAQRSVSTSILPPLPWQLQNNPEQQAEYVNDRVNKNHFVKNIGARIDQEYAMASMLEANQLASNLQAQKNPQADVQWLKATGQAAWDHHHSKSAGSLRRQTQTEKKPPKPKAKPFDPDKLLHPWQRDIVKKRREHNESAKEIRKKAEAQSEEQEQLQDRRTNYFYREDDDDESDSDDDYDQYGQPKRSPGKSPMKSVSSKTNASSSSSSNFLPPIHPSAGGDSKKKSVTKQLAARIKADGGSSPSPKSKTQAASALAAHISDTLEEGSAGSGDGKAGTGRTPIVPAIAAGSDEDEDEDEDEGIGWSPFAVSLE
jgi:hypothetical protein